MRTLRRTLIQENNGAEGPSLMVYVNDEQSGYTVALELDEDTWLLKTHYPLAYADAVRVAKKYGSGLDVKVYEVKRGLEVLSSTKKRKPGR